LSEWPSNSGGRNTAIGLPGGFGFAEENFRRDIQAAILVYQQFENRMKRIKRKNGHINSV